MIAQLAMFPVRMEIHLAWAALVFVREVVAWS